MTTIPFETSEQALRRSAEMWAAVRGTGWQEGNVTQRLYPVAVRTGDAEADAGLPVGVDVALVVTERTWRLDKLVRDDAMEPQEAGEMAELYPAWAAGKAYAVGALVSYNDALYKCRSAHTSQADWQPDVVLSLWVRYRKLADTLLAWVGNEPVKVGWQRTCGGATYTCLQAHVTQADWMPTATIGVLWAEVTEEPVGPQPWVQPTGAHDAYALGALVTHNGQTWESLYAANVWEPGVFGWRVVA
jgi:hypothetical protein